MVMRAPLLSEGQGERDQKKQPQQKPVSLNCNFMWRKEVWSSNLFYLGWQGNLNEKLKWSLDLSKRKQKLSQRNVPALQVPHDPTSNKQQNFYCKITKFVRSQATVRATRNNKGLPWWLSQERICLHAGDPGLIPGSGRSPGEGMAPHSSILAWEIPWTEELDRNNKQSDFQELQIMKFLDIEHKII